MGAAARLPRKAKDSCILDRRTLALYVPSLLRKKKCDKRAEQTITKVGGGIRKLPSGGCMTLPKSRLDVWP